MYISMRNKKRYSFELFDFCNLNAYDDVQIAQDGTIRLRYFNNSILTKDGIIGWDQLGPQMRRYIYNYMLHVDSHLNSTMFHSVKTNQPPVLTADSNEYLPFESSLMTREVFNPSIEYQNEWWRRQWVSYTQQLNTMASIVYLNTFDLTNEQRINSLLSYCDARKALISDTQENMSKTQALIEEMDTFMQQKLTQLTDIGLDYKAILKSYGMNVDHLTTTLPKVQLTVDDLKTLKI